MCTADVFTELLYYPVLEGAGKDSIFSSPRRSRKADVKHVLPYVFEDAKEH